VTPIDYIRVDADILRLRISDKGKLLLGLIKNFNGKALMMSNGDIAELLGCSQDHVVRLMKEINQYTQIENSQSRYRRIFYSGINNGVDDELLRQNGRSKHDSTPAFLPATPAFRTATPAKMPDIIEKNRKNTYISHFEQARKKYPGTKRGLQTEYKNFTRKHKDWKEVLPLLVPAIDRQIERRRQAKFTNKFSPEWKHFQTWVNNRCWEEEVTTESAAISFDSEAAAQRQKLLAGI